MAEVFEASAPPPTLDLGPPDCPQSQLANLCRTALETRAQLDVDIAAEQQQQSGETKQELSSDLQQRTRACEELERLAKSAKVWSSEATTVMRTMQEPGTFRCCNNASSHAGTPCMRADPHDHVLLEIESVRATYIAHRERVEQSTSTAFTLLDKAQDFVAQFANSTAEAHQEVKVCYVRVKQLKTENAELRAKIARLEAERAPHIARMRDLLTQALQHLPGDGSNAGDSSNGGGGSGPGCEGGAPPTVVVAAADTTTPTTAAPPPPPPRPPLASRKKKAKKETKTGAGPQEPAQQPVDLATRIEVAAEMTLAPSHVLESAACAAVDERRQRKPLPAAAPHTGAVYEPQAATSPCSDDDDAEMLPAAVSTRKRKAPAPATASSQ